MKLDIQMFGGRGASSSSNSKNNAYSLIITQALKLATASTPTIANYEKSIEAIGDKSSLQYKKEEYEKEIQSLKKKQTLADGKITGYTVNDIAEQVNQQREYLVHDRDVYFLNYDKKTKKFKSTKVYHYSGKMSLAGRGRHFFMKGFEVKDLVND